MQVLIFLGILAAQQVRPSLAHCEPEEVVLADNQRYSGTVDRIQRALGQDGIGSVQHLYLDETPSRDYTLKVKSARPKIVIIHWSMFDEATRYHPRYLINFIDQIEKDRNGAHPLYLVYSTAFRDFKFPIVYARQPGNAFHIVPSNRVLTMVVPAKDEDRFLPEDASRLVATVKGLIDKGACE